MCRKAFNFLASLTGRVPVETCDGIVYLTKSQIADRYDILTLISRDDANCLAPGDNSAWISFNRIPNFRLWIYFHKSSQSGTIQVTTENIFNVSKTVDIKHVPEVRRFFKPSTVLFDAAKLP